MDDFKNKNVVITGASRGIGLGIAKKLASMGANIAVLAKTDTPHPKLPGTIYSAAKEIQSYGVKSIGLKTDIRFEDQIELSINKVIEEFGSIDILINNASAISLFNSETLPSKQFDLMNDINLRGTYLCSKICLQHLKKSTNPHILNMSPPITLKPKWFEKFTAYTIAKFGMSMCVIGMSEEYKKYNIAVNALWPKTVIDTAAIRMLGGIVKPENCRTVDILSDAAFYILKRESKSYTGKFYIDEEVLAEEGIKDLDKYSVKLGEKLFTDLYLD
jgi:citronellol/citronellal dehydrogenase